MSAYPWGHEVPFSETHPDIRVPWRAIVAEYRDAIAKGDLAPGEPLGSMRSIAATYFVSRTPVRKALAALAAEGLIIAAEGGRYLMPAAAPEAGSA